MLWIEGSAYSMDVGEAIKEVSKEIGLVLKECNNVILPRK